MSARKKRTDVAEVEAPGTEPAEVEAGDGGAEGDGVAPQDVASESGDDRGRSDQDGSEQAAGGEHDYLDDLRRLQAEFENYRKRVTREQGQIATRAAGRVVERLLPVLDNFELAIAHGEGGSGVELVFKELMETLRNEGLEEVPAEGEDFDPRVHDAVESYGGDTVTKVYRRGYRMKGELLRPAMVVVGSPDKGEETDG